ncbi:MAG: hypothetical protein IE912_02675 [Brevundimonas diminuta]|nr:hypothetical protein [Brevundimonas diminuta]MBD3817807.1 hypothetical protein [Brevundimonas diminuta]
MTIAQVAQDKFEYQDFASLVFALEGLDEATLEVRSEPTDGEDTEVRTTIGAALVVFDIQSKDETVGIDLAQLARHLAHPSPHKIDETLLDRLEQDEARTAVFITAGRLRDDAVAFAAPEGWAGRTVVRADPSGTTVSAFLSAFAKVDLNSKTYEARRKTHRQALAARLKPRAAQRLMRRVIVLDRITGTALRQRCVDLIAAHIGGSPAAARALIDPALRLVRDAKATGGDLVPPLRRLLERSRRRRFGSPDYLKRGTEAAWMNTLILDGVLLLAGPPRSGKTQSAEHLADELLDQGYDVVRAEDYLEARRFFYDPAAGPRAVLLDDPLGDGWSIQGPPGAYAGLKALIDQASPTRLLIVAQNQTPLFTASGGEKLATVRTAGQSWIDLSAGSPDLAVRVWEDAARRGHVPTAAARRLSSALQAGREGLDLGALVHLAFSGQVGDGTSVQAMIAIAAQGAGEFASEIAANDPEAALILSAFAMATDEAVGLDELTLAFVLNGPVKARPAHRARLSRVVEVFGRTPAESFPEYKTLPVLTPLQMAKIELLENRRILVRSAYRLQLSHGFYRAAALGLLRQPAAATVTRHLGLMQRGLFCLDPRVSRATARNLARVWAAVPETARPKVVDLAADGLSALYPGTRDLSWRFLIAHLDRISERVRSDLPQWIRNTYSTDLDDLAWRNGEAWIQSGGASFSDSRYFRRTKLDAAQPILEGLEGEAEYAVQPENADTALSYYSARPRRMNARAIRRLLALDEAVLRGDAAKTWVTVPRANDADILDQIFAERHPRIAGDVLDGLADGWAKLSKKRRADLVARMKVFIASPAVAVPLVDTLVLINRVEHFGDDPPWALFGALLPTLLDQLTDEGTGAEPRLFTAVDDAVRHLPASVIVDICRSWIGWLTRTTRRQLRSDYAWGVVSILIDATRATPALRDGLLELLFAHVDETGAAVMLVSEMSYEWDDLTDAERDLLRTLFRAPRRDALWLKAVALTRRSPSDTLVMELIGASLARTARGVIGQLPPDLLDACIEVHLGVEPFGHLGLNCQRRPPWRRIVQRLAADPGHRLGFLCLEALVQEENARRLMPVMPSWIGRLDEIFELLLRHHLRVAGGSDLRAIWIWVFAHASPAQKAAWDKRLSQTVVGLIDELRELDRHLGLDFPDIPQTTAVISPDYHAMVFVSDLVREPSITPAGLETMLQVIIDTVLGLAPVLYGTLDYVSAVLKTKENREHPAWESLKAPRDAALKVHWSIREQRLPVRVVDKGRWKGPM